MGNGSINTYSGNGYVHDKRELLEAVFSMRSIPGYTARAVGKFRLTALRSVRE
jgi:hypothetical protein